MNEELFRNDESNDETMGALPDVPDAGAGSVPITSPNPLDFSTAGITAAGAAGMSTFNDDDDRGLFERTVDVFEEGHIESPFLSDTGAEPQVARRARIYGS
jgi:hypothetical protein